MPDPKSYELSSLIKRLSMLQAQYIDALLKPYGLARTQYKVLHHLETGESLATKELQDRLQVEGATLSGIVDVLEAKGLVERTQQPDDKRRRNVVLTGKGRQIMREITPPGPQVQNALIAGLSKGEVIVLMRVIDKMIENLEHDLGEKTAA